MTDLIDSLDITTKKALAEYLREFVMEERNERLLSVLKNRTRHFTVVLEDLYQTQNISAVMRTCECYGVQDIHIIENENEFTTHSAITMGADKWLTISNYKRCEGNVRQCADRLHAAGYTLVATLPAENSVFILGDHGLIVIAGLAVDREHAGCFAVIFDYYFICVTI